MTKKIIETTLGDLIVALSDEMGRVTKQRQEVPNVVAYLLDALIHNRSGRFKVQNYETIKSMNDIDNALTWEKQG